MTDFPETVPFDRALTATPDELPGALPDTPNTYPVHIRFTGSGSEYFGIWIVNLLLMLVTLGLYWPFARIALTRMRVEAVSATSLVHPDLLASQGALAANDAAGDAAGDLFGFDLGL